MYTPFPTSASIEILFSGSACILTKIKEKMSDSNQKIEMSKNQCYHKVM